MRMGLRPSRCQAGGKFVPVRGQANVGGKVFVQDGVIQGPAPSLPVVVDEV